MATMIDTVKNDLKRALPHDLVDELLSAHKEIKENYLLEKHEPSELNGGKFTEACYRILEYETSGHYTPLGTHIPQMVTKLRAFEQLQRTSTNQSYRIHIPSTLIPIYNVRNARGVGHVGGDVNPNFTDSTLISVSADWVLAELLRIHYSVSLAEAQDMVNAIVVRPTFLVHAVGNVKRVLNPGLKHRDQVLVLLASEHPRSVSDTDLINWIEPGSKTTFITVLRKLHTDRLIEYSSDKQCHILPTGLRYVDQNYSNLIKQ